MSTNTPNETVSRSGKTNKTVNMSQGEKFANKSDGIDDRLRKSIVGVVQYSELKRIREKLCEEKEKEDVAAIFGLLQSDSLKSQKEIQNENNKNENDSFSNEKKITTLTKKSKNETFKRKQIIKLKFDDDDDDDDDDEEDGYDYDNNDNAIASANDNDNNKTFSTKKSKKSKKYNLKLNENRKDEILKTQGSKKSRANDFILKRKRDPTIDTSFLKPARTPIEELKAREQLRLEFIARQNEIKRRKVTIPFTFYDGTHIPYYVRVLLGDKIRIMLENAKNLKKDMKGTISDLMLVIHNIIIPQHYDFYYFEVNKIKCRYGLLFDFDNISSQDPRQIKIVQRSWYERNKHIYPANLWSEFDPEVDYENQILKDKHGRPYYKQ